MIDRTTKALLLAIALGLWVGLVGEWLRPTAVSAAQGGYGVHPQDPLVSIANGTCRNGKIC